MGKYQVFPRRNTSMGTVEKVYWCKEHNAINDECNDRQEIGFIEHND